MKFDVVVSSFKRSIDWTKKYDTNKYNVLIYTKNVSEPESDLNMNVNCGNEASVYLKHIVQNYENLSEKTVFLHDEEYSWHHTGSIIDLTNKHIHYRFSISIDTR